MNIYELYLYINLKNINITEHNEGFSKKKKFFFKEITSVKCIGNNLYQIVI